MYFKAHLKHIASICNIMGKSKEISQDIRKRILDLHESGSSLGEMSRFLKVPRSSVQTSINTMGMSSHHTAQEGDGFCGPEMNVLWSEMCISTQKQKQKTL